MAIDCFPDDQEKAAMLQKAPGMHADSMRARAGGGFRES